MKLRANGMTSSVSADIKNRLLDLVRTKSPRPTELLTLLLKNDVSYSDVQDALALLLDSGEIEMDADRRLHIPPAAA
jgi:hypothetical protein